MVSVTENTVRRWIRRGELEAKFLGGRSGYRVERSELRKFLRRPDGMKRKLST